MKGVRGVLTFEEAKKVGIRACIDRLGYDFVKKYQYTYYTDKALSGIADDIAFFARREGLEAHARSALVRKEVS